MLMAFVTFDSDFNHLHAGNPKRILLQSVKTQMKCNIMVYTVCKGKEDVQTKEYLIKKLKPDTPRFVKWTIPSLMYQTKRKNPLVYKGVSAFYSLPRHFKSYTLKNIRTS